MRQVMLYFGDPTLERDWDQAGMDDRLAAVGISTYQPTDDDVLGARWKQRLRRGLVRTLIYAEWARRGSVTLRTKLARRRACRQRLEIAFAGALDAVVGGVKLARAIETWLPPAEEAHELMRGQQPDLVVVATDIYRGQEVELVKAAKAHGIPTLGLVGSWDNLTSKGHYLVPPDHIGVWGEVSAKQANDLHGFTSLTTHVVGCLRMDVPADKGTVFADPQLPMVMVAGTTLAYWQHEDAVVSRLAEAGKKYGFWDGFWVWYRPHPRRLSRMSAYDVGQLRNKWGLEGVYYDTGEGQGRLAAILAHAKVVVSSFSTLVVEAALLGTPSLLVGFGQSSESGTLDIHAGFEHMAEVSRWPGVTLCRSMGALEQWLRFWIKEKDQDESSIRAACRGSALRVVRADGHTAERLTALISDLTRR